MKYMLFLYQDENAWESMSDAEKGEVFNAHFAYRDAMKKAGAYVSGDPLEHSRMSKRVRESGVQDGPFADTKEQLGGYYMIDVENMDDALEWAARCPAASTGHVEIRPVWDIPS